MGRNLGQALLVPARGVAGAKAAASFVAASTATAAGTSCTPAPPAGIQAGDVLVAVASFNTTGDTPGASFSGGTGGWTARTGTVSTPGGLAAVRVFSRVATGSEPGTYTASDAAGAATAIRATILAYRPAAGTTLAVAGDLAGNASGTSQATPAIAVGNGNATVVVFGAAPAGHSWTPPAGMTEESDVGVNMTVGAFDVVPVAAGSVGKTATLNTADEATMAIVALVPQ